ncbi:hypothetical protein D3C81_1690300 [compost metagenome]
MEHRGHFLALRGHQHGWNVDTPTVRDEKNDLFLVAAHLFYDLQTLPVNPVLDFLRATQGKLCHHHHRLRSRCKHLIDDGFALGFTALWKTQG